MDPELSIVLVSYEMEGVLSRTLRSLSRGYQLGMDNRSYEIIVIDNGSARMPALSPPDGVDFMIRRASYPSVSPVGALNEGLALSRGRMIGAWIDGARMASPGLLASCLAAARGPRDVIATFNYRLGRRSDAIAAEARADHETASLEAIDWPANGYGLFSISSAEQEGERAGLLESNALFLSREMWGELGGYDPAFDEPAGGAANPDMLRRAVEAPGARLVRICGEGTFHQFHGGVTSSDTQASIRAIKDMAKRYNAIRGRPLARVREVGTLFSSAFCAPNPEAPV